ncbi:MAG: peptide chain release factor N(5)-glutamine methyltransferase [Anaerolineales bacterium]|nr:peptide chain release factor N(5)-glutamine methyltransferase [Anaerolineales bacterium]
MNHPWPYGELLAETEGRWSLLEDKPEETPQNTLRALWFLAAGEPRAVERCMDDELPVLSSQELARLRELLQQRTAGTPLAHLTGRQCFMGIEMLAGPEALIPRKETEILGQAALDTLRRQVIEQGAARVIDLCTGCGNLALSLAYHEPNCQVFAADLSAEAIELARRNARFLSLEARVGFEVGDLFAPFDRDGFQAGVDMVVCNPPYISTQHIDEMPAEISRHEPHLAFDGGPFGVSIVFRLIKEAPNFLRPGAWLCFEVGVGQGELITARLARSGAYSDVTPLLDSNGNVRALQARRT